MLVFPHPARRRRGEATGRGAPIIDNAAVMATSKTRVGHILPVPNLHAKHVFQLSSHNGWIDIDTDPTLDTDDRFPRGRTAVFSGPTRGFVCKESIQRTKRRSCCPTPWRKA